MVTLYDLLQPLQKQKLNRLSRVMKEGSPKYHYDVSALAASASEGITIEQQFPRAMKYAPIDNCRVINQDTVAIALTFNGNARDNYYIIPASSIRHITREEIGGIHTILITNLDGAVAVTQDLIDIEFWRAPEDADSVARSKI